MKYFYEKLSGDDYKIGYGIKKNIYSKKNKNNKIEIIENPFLGKLFILNGLIKLTEKYEFVLSEMIAHSVMFSHPKPEKILLISEFDRGVIKEIAKHKSVSEIYFISNNKEAQEAFEDNFPTLKLKSDPKIKIIFDDPINYIKNFQDYFDVIIVDSNNPDFKNKDFLKSVSKSLTKEGMFELSCPFLKESLAIKNEFKPLKSVFKYETFLKTPMNLQIFSNLGIMLCSKKIDVSEINLRVLATRFKQFKEAKKLQYYSPEIHLSSMIIPKFYKLK